LKLALSIQGSMNKSCICYYPASKMLMLMGPGTQHEDTV
jgi:hypothetical protein